MGAKMKNAPVYYTVAQVRHNPVLQLEKYKAEIQDRMRKAGYSDFRSAKSVLINFAAALSGTDQSSQLSAVPQTVDRYFFSNRDATAGFIVEPSSFAYQTTEYDTFDQFLPSFLKGLEIVHQCVTLDFSDRLGIRYLDAVVPKQGEDLSKYLVPGVLGLSTVLEGENVGLSISETHMTSGEGNVLARTIITAGHLAFPQDLTPQGLNVADRFQAINGLHAILDTDASFEAREPFDLEKLAQRSKVLHQKIRKAFDATITPYANEAWN